MAPQPKPPGARRRRNAGQPQWRQLVADAQVQIPALPGSTWLDETVSWWNTVWSSPMAQAWLAADVPALVRLAFLMDQVFMGDVKKDILNEIVKLEDRFGLNPKARRALQWEIEQADPGAVESPSKVRKLRAVG